MAKALRAADRPESTVGLNGVVKNDQQESDALHERGFIKALRESLKAELDHKIAQLKTEFAALYFVEVDGTTVSLDDRDKALSEGLDAYGEKAHQDLLSPKSKKKSINMLYGTVGFREAPEHMEFLEGKNVDDVLASLERVTTVDKERGGVHKQLKTMIEGVRLFDGEDAPCVSLLFDVELIYRSTRALQAVKDDKITNGELRRLNLRHVPAVDNYYAKPAAFQADKAA